MPSTIRILVATTNPGKLREIMAVVDDPAVTLIGLDALGRDIAEPVEDGDTFEANAVLKARHYAAATGVPTVADDSGLEVDALGGAPGVRSARYAGVDGPRDVRDPANNRKLLDELHGVPPERRTARFVCAMAFVSPPAADGDAAGGSPACLLAERDDPDDALVVRGTIEGRILLPEEAADPDRPAAGRGANGFGYDPLFLVPDLGKTTAEMAPAEKNAISHRGQATRAMWQRLKPLLALGTR